MLEVTNVFVARSEVKGMHRLLKEVEMYLQTEGVWEIVKIEWDKKDGRWIVRIYDKSGQLTGTR